jgi:hypothetical protein
MRIQALMLRVLEIQEMIGHDSTKDQTQKALEERDTDGRRLILDQEQEARRNPRRLQSVDQNRSLTLQPHLNSYTDITASSLR